MGLNGVCHNSIKAAVDVTGGLVPKLSVHRRASVPLEILIDPGGAPPFRVQPDQNSQGTDLHGTGRKNLHLPQTVIIYGRYIGRPYRPPCGEQASVEAFRELRVVAGRGTAKRFALWSIGLPDLAAGSGGQYRGKGQVSCWE